VRIAQSAIGRCGNFGHMLILELALVLLFTLINGVLAMSELAVASSRLPKLRNMADQGVNGARRAIELASDPGRFLSTVQIGITLIGILAGAVSGATLGLRFTAWLESVGLPDNLAEPVGYGLVIGGITYVSLIIGELVPKQLALRNPERIACLVAPAMTVLAKIAAPIVALLKVSGSTVLALLGQNKAKEQTVTDAEIHSLIAEAEEAGVLAPEERSMISGVMRLGDRPVKSVMVPRADVAMIDVTAKLEDLARLMADTNHSRFVVFEDNKDHIVGVLQLKDVTAALLKKRVFSVKRLMKQAPIISDTTDALDVVGKLKESEVHVGLICDEYGNFEGIVTTADILEAIVGTFKEDKGEDEEAVVSRADGSYLVAGWANVDVLTDTLLLQLPVKRDYHTVAGFVLDGMGRLPKAGEFFDRGKWRFEVLDLDGRRIDKVLVQPVKATTRRAA
jgi:putative hemolysin